MKFFYRLLLIVVMSMPVCAQALPFVPTADPNLPTNYCYFLKTEGLYCIATDNLDIKFQTSADANNDKCLWCFVDDPGAGYRLYNKGTGRYLQQESLVYDDSYSYTYYQDVDGTAFNLTYYLSGWNVHYYLFMNVIQDQYGFMRYMDYDTEKKGVFTVELAKEGAPLPPDPAWTRFDKNEVGYGYIDGGKGAFESESSKNLVDNNALTKYFGNFSNCWLIMKSSSDVAVQQYSIVTANDSRQYYDRVLRSWKLQGSNDCATWEDIDVRTDYPMPFDDLMPVTFIVNDTRKFRYFKFMATKGVTDNSNVQISEVWINEQVHRNIGINPDEYHGCGHQQTRSWQCGDCNARGRYLITPTTAHNYVDGICTVCGLAEGETVLLYNGQSVFPYYVKALHADRISDNVWPQAPEGWNNVGFDDGSWINLPLPMASPGHSGGPYTNLLYNSYWYNEYNCYWIRRVFNIDELIPNSTYTLRCVHDDNMVVYVNGKEVVNAQGWTNASTTATWSEAYETFNIPASAFRAGENVLAVYMQQNWGGAYFDCSLSRIKKNSLTGDVDGSGIVDVDDVNAAINLILDYNGYKDKYPGSADLDGNGMVDVDDVNILINIILGAK